MDALAVSLAPRPRILVVEDDPGARDALEKLLADRYIVETTETAETAEAKLDAFRPDIVLTDVRLPGISGLELIPRVHNHLSDCVVIVMTAFSSIDTAISAMKAGARDYVVKPINFDALDAILAREVDHQKIHREVRQLREQLERSQDNEVWAESAQMEEVLNVAETVAESMATVLITGESGTGKEVVARHLHRHSNRASGPFIAVNCGAIPENLIESEFFGHEKGAFTGAVERKIGRFERANGGTIFLDEIAELPLNLQVRLLRVLQDHTFDRVGGTEVITVDCRVLAATNRDIEALTKAGGFREDLYYRLNVFELNIPPLRDRPADIAGLWARFLRRVAEREHLEVPDTPPEVYEALHAYTWPGNVRELENVAERTVILSRGLVVKLQHLPATVRAMSDTSTEDFRIPGSSLKDIEKIAILRTLAAVDGDKHRAASLLGISLRKIQYRLREWREEAERADRVGGE